MDSTYIKIEYYSHHTTIYASGDWTIHNISDIDKALRGFSCHQSLVLDFSAVSSFDSSGILLFMSYFDKFKSHCKVEVVGYSEDQERMYHLLLSHKVDDAIPKIERGVLYNIGKSVVSSYSVFVKFIGFAGYIVVAFFRYFMHPSNIRVKEVVYYMERSGVGALFIVALTSFLVGMVISYQSAVELAKFGADIFIVDLAGISITRELAPLITAIVVAGRSGSAYTAQIGAMKITEEISAMRTMGFDPYYFLILPRMIALMISLPLLIFFADVMGMAGSIFASYLELGISLHQFLDRLQEVLDVKHFWIGIIKGPFFAILIVMIGCFRGLQVTDDTESIGYQTTASVVNSIFFVIACDAIFSVLLTRWGL
ncbi:Putative ABC transport system permease protein [hydrothermal vent metagenome]|uniref:Putative ABC transport system permease protein n=1 Tax=hydrothermal vent metagenome TaxID=652676 RepID=A0A1W1BHN0_9ZZZZ